MCGCGRWLERGDRSRSLNEYILTSVSKSLKKRVKYFNLYNKITEIILGSARGNHDKGVSKSTNNQMRFVRCLIGGNKYL